VVPLHVQAQRDRATARSAGEPRDPAPYLDRYAEWRGARSAADLWLMGWDAEDERLAIEESHPRFPGEVEWRLPCSEIAWPALNSGE
jgi:hypothetical protein